VQVPTPPRGEAARNRFFAVELLMKQLGVRVERKQGLDAMPPPQARLLLASPHWDLFPERAGRLRDWVQSGGHLVIPANIAAQRELAAWIPMEQVQRPPTPRRSMPSRRGNLPASEMWCRPMQDAASADYRFCVAPPARELRPRAGVTPQWLLQGADHGVEMLRAPLGRGSVTVFGGMAVVQNREVLQADHAAIAAAALQLERGALVWMVTEESRTPLLAWLWDEAWVAVVLVLAFVLAAVWRSAARFGPVGAAPLPQRRSMKEQLAGTGEFLRHRGAAALHAAQVRALHEAARARVPGYSQLATAAAMQAIARRTSLDAAALERALKPGVRRADRLPADLELLESARRRLARNPVSPPS
jgi:hypothetical protein